MRAKSLKARAQGTHPTTALFSVVLNSFQQFCSTLTLRRVSLILAHINNNLPSCVDEQLGEHELLVCFEALERMQERAKALGKTHATLCARTERGDVSIFVFCNPLTL